MLDLSCPYPESQIAPEGFRITVNLRDAGGSETGAGRWRPPARRCCSYSALWSFSSTVSGSQLWRRDLPTSALRGWEESFLSESLLLYCWFCHPSGRSSWGFEFQFGLNSIWIYFRVCSQQRWAILQSSGETFLWKKSVKNRSPRMCNGCSFLSTSLLLLVLFHDLGHHWSHLNIPDQDPEGKNLALEYMEWSVYATEETKWHTL